MLYVMDLTGLQYNKRLYTLVTGAMRALSEFMAHHYVEMIKNFVLVNVPSFIYTIWTLAKPLLPERTRHKVRILSSGGWRDEILQYSCPQALPAKWNTDECTLFEAQVDPPVPYPEQHFYRHRAARPPALERLRLAARKTQLLSRELRRGQRLRWWVLADADFGFGVFFSRDRDEKDVQE